MEHLSFVTSSWFLIEFHFLDFITLVWYFRSTVVLFDDIFSNGHNSVASSPMPYNNIIRLVLWYVSFLSHISSCHTFVKSLGVSLQSVGEKEYVNIKVIFHFFNFLILKIRQENVNIWILLPICLHTSYLTDSYIVFILKSESGQNVCLNKWIR